jgi:preprotein translocase subunit SecD
MALRPCSARFALLSAVCVAFLLPTLPVSAQRRAIGGGVVSGTKLGLNLGGGLEVEIGFFRLYGDAKVVTDHLDRFVAAAGVRLPLR